MTFGFIVESLVHLFPIENILDRQIKLISKLAEFFILLFCELDRTME